MIPSSVPCIIGNNSLKPNKINSMYDNVLGGYPALRVRGHYVKLHIMPVSRRKRTAVVARRSYIIPAGTRVHIDIRQGRLPKYQPGYTFIAQHIADLATETFASAGNRLVNGDEERLPFDNLGLCDVHVRRGQKHRTGRAIAARSRPIVFSGSPVQGSPYPIGRR